MRSKQRVKEIEEKIHNLLRELKKELEICPACVLDALEVRSLEARKIFDEVRSDFEREVVTLYTFVKVYHTILLDFLNEEVKNIKMYHLITLLGSYLDLTSSIITAILDESMRFIEKRKPKTETIHAIYDMLNDLRQRIRTTSEILGIILKTSNQP